MSYLEAKMLSLPPPPHPPPGTAKGLLFLLLYCYSYLLLLSKSLYEEEVPLSQWTEIIPVPKIFQNKKKNIKIVKNKCYYSLFNKEIQAKDQMFCSRPYRENVARAGTEHTQLLSASSV